MNTPHNKSLLAMLATLALAPASLLAQSATTEPAKAAETPTEEEALVLSPFVVSAEEDTGYLANATTLGGRTRTELKDVASAIQVVTSQFLSDTKATDNQSLLKYTTNTEVGGIYGNYAGVGNTFINGAGESALNFQRPNGNTRVRGLDSADNTRDLIKTDIPWNSYNVGRVDFQRGPNSILFGVGSPAGIINASTNTAGVGKTEGNIENQLSSFGSVRTTLDYNYVLIPKTLAVRVDAAYSKQKYRQKPAFEDNKSVFTALRWDPKLFGKNSTARTSIRANYEHGDVKANRPHYLPPSDRITPFFDPNALNQRLVDTALDYATGLYPWKSGSSNSGGPFKQTANNWISSGAFGGNNPQLFFNNNVTPIRASAGSITSYFAPTGTIGAFAFTVPAGIADLGEYANNVEKYGAQNNLPADLIRKYAGGLQGFWKGQSLTNTNIFDFYNKLIDGPSKKEWAGWQSYNFTLEQSFLNDRLNIQAVYDRQSYHDGGQSLLGWSPAITVDNNKYTTDLPSMIDGSQLNPNAGRAYVAGTGSANGRWTDRKNILVTAKADLRASDFLDAKSKLARILGRHSITGNYSREEYLVEDRAWALYAANGDWNKLLGYDRPGTPTGKLYNSNINNTIYLSGDLRGKSVDTLNLDPVKNDIVPASTLPIRYFDSHWKWSMNPSDPSYVDPKGAWTNPANINGMGVVQAAGVNTDNPANYVGWTTATISILNANKGDIDQLYTSGSKISTKTTSKSGTWQAFLLDDTIVGTFGYRRDRLEQRAGQALPDAFGLAPVNSYDLAPLQADGINEASTSSWGLVARLPKSLRGKLPWGMDIALSYSDGKNTRVENRYGFSGNRLPNAKGHTKDASLMVTMLDDRLSFKVTHYDTLNKDANISSVGGANATLGAATYDIYAKEANGTLSALVDAAGLNGEPGMDNWAWYWNWANMTGGFSKYSGFNPKTDADFLANPETIKEKAAVQSWLDQMLPQSWYDAYGIDINVAQAKALDYYHAVNHGKWTPLDYINIGNGGGKINGQYPTGTVDTRSTGWEFEVAGKPMKNLDISVNASKQFARQQSLGEDLVNFITTSYKKYNSPAGDLRLWWGGDTSFKNVFNGGIWPAYQFQAQTNGKMVNEMAPWRANVSGTYHIDRGVFKGGYVGGSYRWQDGTILGYRMNATLDNYDVNKPIWSKSEDWIDLWVGYNWKLTNKLGWKTQLNLRNVGQKTRLKAISVQPDGSAAGYRIEEGLTWQFSNTLTF